uniref:AlNc14C671G12382 protein n=1 Tax=Albugo laibachii Nc14 TaxID=890382 RepID=F0X1R5_9STRA|nr:AlNc14C671G12382 [Albugo laibachii Nc14]|eukprot:CCA27767.1 AlNc14C671G12382 [Albugo laibachii Nc14]
MQKTRMEILHAVMEQPVGPKNDLSHTVEEIEAMSSKNASGLQAKSPTGRTNSGSPNRDITMYEGFTTQVEVRRTITSSLVRSIEDMDVKTRGNETAIVSGGKDQK